MNAKAVTAIVESRVLVFPNLHDAEIVGLSPLLHKGEWQLKVEVERDSVDIFAFEFSGVRNLICNFLNFQNVIDNVAVLSTQELLGDLEKYRAIFGLDSVDHQKHFVSDVERGKLFLVEFSPSNGVELIIVSRGMRVVQTKST